MQQYFLQNLESFKNPNYIFFNKHIIKTQEDAEPTDELHYKSPVHTVGKFFKSVYKFQSGSFINMLAVYLHLKISMTVSHTTYTQSCE